MKELNVGDKVKVIDKNDMNFKIKGEIIEKDDEPDVDGIYALIVKFKHTRVPYYPNQLRKTD